ncbi:hypothetical protein [Sphingobium sp. WCS2017Hpa-17]|uniref:hypothetical protein n=1 Tax=Sphingobium sp. WCS2017Hpa-17 TaxID=3073638 RepID=UPI0028898154|nr:hypothetical protein [Sphingobium sp. WCS2017Hpa-17]
MLFGRFGDLWASPCEQPVGSGTQLIPGDNGYNFRGSGTRTTKPSCHTGAENQWFIDTSTPAGQAMVATVISAFYNGNTMNIFGTDTCLPGQSNVEAVKTIQVLP